MTAIKCKPVRSGGHLGNVAAYIDDERAVARDTINIIEAAKWRQEMEAAIRAYGHEKAGRPGAKPTLAFHMVIAFNPAECDMSGPPAAAGGRLATRERPAAEAPGQTPGDLGNGTVPAQPAAQAGAGRWGEAWAAEAQRAIADAMARNDTYAGWQRELAGRGISTASEGGERWYVVRGHEDEPLAADQAPAGGVGAADVAERFAGTVPDAPPAAGERRAGPGAAAPVTAEVAMEYARAYISESFPECQAALTLHDEGGRWAVHCVVNRTELASGRRFDRDRSAQWAEHERQAVLDRAYGLIDRMERGGHYAGARGQTGMTPAAKSIAERGEASWKLEAYADIAEAMNRCATMADWQRDLAKQGISTGVAGGERWYVVKGHEGTPLKACHATAYGIGDEDVAARFTSEVLEGQAAWRERREGARVALAASRAPLSRDERAAARAFATKARAERTRRVQELYISSQYRDKKLPSWKRMPGEPSHRKLRATELELLTPAQRRRYEDNLKAEAAADRREDEVAARAYVSSSSSHSSSSWTGSSSTPTPSRSYDGPVR